EAQLPLALECGGLDVDPSDDDHVLVHAAHVFRTDIGDQWCMVAIQYATAVGLHQLHRIGGPVGHGNRLLRAPGTPPRAPVWLLSHSIHGYAMCASCRMRAGHNARFSW